MNVYHLVNDLAEKNIVVGLNEGKLVVYDPDKNLTGELTAVLKTHKAALIDYLTYGDALTHSDFPFAQLDSDTFKRIKAIDVDLQNIYIATPMQEGMLYHGLLDGAGVAYTVQTFGELNGPLDTQAFIQAWQYMVARHEVFRTSFVGIGEAQIHQLVHEKAQLPVIELDYSTLSPQQQQQALVDFRKQDRQQGFDFDKAPLMRIALCKLSSTRYHFVWCYHHVLLDGWCNSLIFGELMQVYQALSQHQQPQLAPVTPYVDYIGWLFAKDKEQPKRFWRQQLQGVVKPTPLPLKNINVSASETFAELPVLVDKDNSLKLSELAKAHHTTLNVLLQFAWAYLLHCYSGEEEVIFGVTISGRPPELAGVEQMVGLFINSIPSKMVFDDSLSVVAQICDLHAQNVERNEHGYLSLTDIQQQSQIPRGMSLFDSLVIYENYPIGQTGQTANSDQQVSIALVESEEQTNYGLTLYASFTEQLLVTIHYRQEQFTAKAVAQIGEHLEQILTTLASADLTLPLAEANLLGARGEVDVMRGPVVAPCECFIQRFSAQAQQNPNKIALVCENRSLSYQQLDRQANQLAHYLQNDGIKQGDFVAVCLHRTPELMQSLLAVQKIGATYIPVSPDYPQERVEYMLQHANAAKVLTTTAIWQVLDLPQQQTQMLDDKNVQDTIATQSVTPVGLAKPIGLDDLAYVIYTSGSTGKPKGVCIGHGAMGNFLTAMSKTPGLTHNDSLLAITPISFDISVLELYLPLLVGGTVHLADEALSKDAFAISAYIDKYNINVMQATPATWQMLDTIDDWAPKVEFKALCGGEALPQTLANGMVKKYHQVWNMYGPTETTVWSGCHLVTDVVVLGQPIDNTQFYILDANLKPTLAGMAGDLYIAGDGLASGYLHAPQLTAERFIDNPYEPGSRLYKTGDVVRMRHDSNLDYLGRADDQVKIRGFRIELGEIEQQLSLLDNVQTCAVVVNHDQALGPRLVGYVVLNVVSKAPQHSTIGELDQNAIKASLAKVLPDYMIPSVIVALSELPLTPNDKVDRRALQAIEVDIESSRLYVAPRNQLESILVSIWADVLALDSEKIGINDSFFELGGHSLLAIKLSKRIHTELNILVNARQLFENPTIALFAADVQKTIDSQMGGEHLHTEIALKHNPTPNQAVDVPLTPNPMYALYNSNEEDRNTWLIRETVNYQQPINIDMFKKAVQVLFQRHDALRLSYYQDEQQVWRSNILPVDDKVYFELFDITAKSPAEVEQAYLQLKEKYSSANVTDGPMLYSVYVVDYEKSIYQVKHVLQHYVADQFSFGILLRELDEIYFAMLSGTTANLPANPLSYYTYAHYLQDYCLSNACLSQKDYWLSTLTEKATTVTCQTLAPNQMWHNTTLVGRLAPQTTKQLIELSYHSRRYKMFDLMLESFIRAYAQWKGDDRVFLNLILNGRTSQHIDIDKSNLVGWISELIPVSMAKPEVDSRKASLDAVVEQLKQVPEDKSFGLLRDCHPDKAVRDLFIDVKEPQINFNYLGESNTQLENSEGDEQSPFPIVENQPPLRKHYLLIEIRTNSNGLEVFWDYVMELFTQQQIQKLNDLFIAQLENLCEEVELELINLL